MSTTTVVDTTTRTGRGPGGPTELAQNGVVAPAADLLLCSSPVEQVGEFSPGWRPPVRGTVIFVGFDGVSEGEPTHRIERVAEAMVSHASRQVRGYQVGCRGGDLAGKSPFERCEAPMQLGVLGGGDPHPQPHRE